LKCTQATKVFVNCSVCVRVTFSNHLPSNRYSFSIPSDKIKWRLSTNSSKITALSLPGFLLQNLKHLVSFASSPSSTNKAKYLASKTSVFARSLFSSIYLSSAACIVNNVFQYNFCYLFSYFIYLNQVYLQREITMDNEQSSTIWKLSAG